MYLETELILQLIAAVVVTLFIFRLKSSVIIAWVNTKYCHKYDTGGYGPAGGWKAHFVISLIAVLLIESIGMPYLMYLHGFGYFRNVGYEQACEAAENTHKPY